MAHHDATEGDQRVATNVTLSGGVRLARYHLCLLVSFGLLAGLLVLSYVGFEQKRWSDD